LVFDEGTVSQKHLIKWRSPWSLNILKQVQVKSKNVLLLNMGNFHPIFLVKQQGKVQFPSEKFSLFALVICFMSVL
jgi:hypothetical protein